MSRAPSVRMKDLPPEQRKRLKEAKRKATAAEQAQFMAYIDAAGLPTPQPECRFDENRRWRWDWCWPREKLALEIDGGAYIAGRHTQGAGFEADMEKHSAGAALGWRLLRIPPKHLYEPRTLDLIRRALEAA